MSLSDIIFENIDSKYAYGQYGEFKVIIMKENRYINATKLCNDYGKQFCHWLETKSGKDLIKEVNDDIILEPIGKAMSPIIKKDRGTHNDLKGTYVHELLIPHIAGWISSKFAIKISRIVNNYIINEFNDIIRKKDDKIDILLKRNEEIIKQNEELLKKSDFMEHIMQKMNIKMDTTLSELDEAKDDRDRITDKLNETSEILHETSNKLDETTESLQLVTQKLNIAVEDRVVHTKAVSTHEYFILLKNEKAEYTYYAVRGQQRYINKKIADMHEYKRILCIQCIPNSSNLWLLIKEQMKGKIKYKGNHMNINISEEELIACIHDINNQKRNV